MVAVDAMFTTIRRTQSNQALSFFGNGSQSATISEQSFFISSVETLDDIMYYIDEVLSSHPQIHLLIDTFTCFRFK